MMKRLVTAALAAALVGGPASAPARAATPVEINVILSLTGRQRVYRHAEQQSLGVLEKIVNAQGGIRGNPARFVIADDASNPQNTLQLTNSLVAKHAPVIIGPSYTSGCNAIATPARKNRARTILSLAGHPRGARRLRVLRRRRHRRDRGGGSPLLPRTRSYALRDDRVDRWQADRDHEAQVNAALKLPENSGMQLVATEHFNSADVSVTRNSRAIKARRPQALITTATGVAFGTVLRNLADSGSTFPPPPRPATCRARRWCSTLVRSARTALHGDTRRLRPIRRSPAALRSRRRTPIQESRSGARAAELSRLARLGSRADRGRSVAQARSECDQRSSARLHRVNCTAGAGSTACTTSAEVSAASVQTPS